MPLRDRICPFNDLKQFYDSSLIDYYNTNLDKLPDTNILDIATLSFGEFGDNLVKYQNLFLKHHIKDEFFYTVFDNNYYHEPYISYSKKCRDVCLEENIAYVRVPRLDGRILGQGDTSCALGNNVIFNKYFRRRGSRYCGILEQDVYPFTDMSIISKLKCKPIYGSLSKFSKVVPSIKSIFPAVFILDSVYFRNFYVDFLPAEELYFNACNVSSHNYFRFMKYTLDNDCHILRGTSLKPNYSALVDDSDGSYWCHFGGHNCCAGKYQLVEHNILFLNSIMDKGLKL